MAVLKGPGLSIDASGKFADTLVFSKWKGINYARRWLKPHNPRTDAQRAQRHELATAVFAWQQLDTATQESWNVAAKGLAMSGFNYYVQQYIKQNCLLENKQPTIP